MKWKLRVCTSVRGVRYELEAGAFKSRVAVSWQCLADSGGRRISGSVSQVVKAAGEFAGRCGAAVVAPLA